MYSIIVFCFTLLELSAVAFGYFAGPIPEFHDIAGHVFNSIVVYGSPIYTFMHLLKQDSAWKEMNLAYILIATLHVIKYFSFLRGQILEDGNALMKSAIIMEGAYLLLCAYYSI